MPAMTMVHKTQDPKMLKSVKAGDKVKFNIEKINGQLTATKIDKAK
jgi:Cu(I)/Ag(I) efflux system periplasmic protein CusF